MVYVLAAFAVYVTLVGVMLASAPWWGVAAILGCLLTLTCVAAPEAGRALASASAVFGREPDDA